MTPQLAEKVFTSSGPVEDKAFRFKLITSKLQRFFNGDVMQAGKELPELAISKAYKVMPELFKTFVNVAPSRHIAELILFANMAIPFSENASIMNIVSYFFLFSYKYLNIIIVRMPAGIVSYNSPAVEQIQTGARNYSKKRQK